ncbi:MAG: phosphomethylpyrimidine synthase ThiC [bacterium]|nr:phosphomethylpyrimidine synthase ThiC [bacterium]MDD5354193.1 phosphomethylpyrimidine synthase ThiC [bacterium]MDD5756325.1 phosphomethylpyrimidine synthase ThiC [bacterium]
MTQMELARAGKVTQEMRQVARQENISAELIRQLVAKGRVAIVKNKIHKKSDLKICGVGQNLRTKVNANIGTSPKQKSVTEEKKKLAVCIKYGADAVMDLSTGGDLRVMRRAILKNSTIPLGTVPIYQAVVDTVRQGKNVPAMKTEALFDTIEEQCRDGVDFITVHCGVTRKVIETLRKHKRVTGMVSRGGTFLAEWVVCNKKENPLYEHYDRLLDIAYKYDVVLSLGDGLRPGCGADATDESQIAELKILGELAKRAWRRNVQVMIEGPGHVPLNQIEKNIILQKKLCSGAPFYVLGPLVTDIAPGYDHITSAIGGALAASYGADFLCYVTPAEHLRLPDIADVKEGIMASRIAAHAADIVKGISGAAAWDKKMSIVRKALDWKKQSRLSLDPEKFTEVKTKKHLRNKFGCTMCGEFCSMKEMDKIL